MKSDLLLKDGKIASLETLCKEKDCQLNSLQNLKQDLIIKDERLTQLERLCKDKDNQLSSLQNILRESLETQKSEAEDNKEKISEITKDDRPFIYVSSRIKDPSNVIGKNKDPEIVFISDSVGKFIDQERFFGKKKVCSVCSSKASNSKEILSSWNRLESVETFIMHQGINVIAENRPTESICSDIKESLCLAANTQRQELFILKF